MFNRQDKPRNACMLQGRLEKCGYDWWWHSFVAHNVVTEEEKAFFIECYLCNPDLAEDTPVLRQMISNKKEKKRPRNRWLIMWYEGAF